MIELLISIWIFSWLFYVARAAFLALAIHGTGQIRKTHVKTGLVMFAIFSFCFWPVSVAYEIYMLIESKNKNEQTQEIQTVSEISKD